MPTAARETTYLVLILKYLRYTFTAPGNGNFLRAQTSSDCMSIDLGWATGMRRGPCRINSCQTSILSPGQHHSSS